MTIEFPKGMENRISLKKMTFNILEDSLMAFKEISESNNSKVILLTALGIIKGRLSPFVEGIDFIKQSEEDHPNVELVDNGAFISLHEVELISASNPNKTINLPQMIIFVDQIIGFSLTNE